MTKTYSTKCEAAALLRELAARMPDQEHRLSSRALRAAEKLEGRATNEQLVVRRIARASCYRTAVESRW